jgi:formamidopyrimidine-DNA glycosylase
MPELPEVESTMRGISPHIKQQIIKQIVVRQYQLRWPIQRDLPQLLLGKTIHQLERRGKYLLLRIDQGALILHLGMSGHLRILTKNLSPYKHDHLDIHFANGSILRFTDPRRFGACLWVADDPMAHRLLKELGPEPLSKYFSGRYLWLKAKNKTLPIKSLIMNSKVVTGVGNIYAAEALFASGIHPQKAAKTISIERMHLLVKEIKKILRLAIKQGGTTIKDFLHSNGKPGYFSQQLKVYGRQGQACMVCEEILILCKIGQRSTVYCAQCQML